MSTTTCFRGEIRKISVLSVEENCSSGAMFMCSVFPRASFINFVDIGGR